MIRHAQAGTRDNYDVLSDLGHRQAELLGKHLVAQEIELEAVYAGNMRRQQQTAEIACEAYRRAGLPVPGVITDERWNEFSLLSIYRALEKRLREESPEFARDFDEMQEALRVDPHTTAGATGRCDVAVVRAWVEDRYPDAYEGQSWAAFQATIKSCMSDLSERRNEKAVAIFTSATPVAILAAAALSLSEEKLLSVLGVLYNTSLTVVQSRSEGLRLFTLNTTPHLPDSLRTYR